MPVPPHNNFKLRSHYFNNILLDQNQQYLSRRSVDIYDLIHRDHAALIFSYQYEYPLRDPFSRTFFLEFWYPLMVQLYKLKEFRGGVDTFFPVTFTVESYVLFVNYGKDNYWIALKFLSLELILKFKKN